MAFDVCHQCGALHSGDWKSCPVCTIGAGLEDTVRAVRRLIENIREGYKPEKDLDGSLLNDPDPLIEALLIISTFLEEAHKLPEER